MDIDTYISQIVLPKKGSRKGENGRVLVIGGSRLFHAAAFWSASMASKVVDLVHFTSPAMENNELMRIRAKEKFWDGIVVDWADVDHYIEEDDCILIGPGMERGEETKRIVDQLLGKYPSKRWVVDGGALQMVDVTLLNKNMIVTPNEKELLMLAERLNIPRDQKTNLPKEIAAKLGGITVLAKGEVDIVTDGEEVIEIAGGNPGMTKGGTGDVLAGLVAALCAKSPAFASAAVASRVNKMAGERLEKKVDTFFSASDLIPELQLVLGELFRV